MYGPQKMGASRLKLDTQGQKTRPSIAHDVQRYANVNAMLVLVTIMCAMASVFAVIAMICMAVSI